MTELREIPIPTWARAWELHEATGMTLERALDTIAPDSTLESDKTPIERHEY